MKKLIPALLALCFLLTSCGLFTIEYTITGDTTKDLSIETPETSYTQITPKPPVTLPALDPTMSADKQLSTLPDMDFAEKYFGKDNTEGVAYFVIATVDNAPIFSDADELSGSSVAAALNAVEEKFNLDLINEPYTPDEFDAKIKENQLAGTYFADLLSLPRDVAKTYATSEYCKDLATLPFVSKDSPYFISDFFEYGGEMADYAVMSNASYLTSELYCLYFDASAVSDEIYTKALSQELTWDYVLELMNKTGRGMNSLADISDLYRLTSGARFTLENKKTVLKKSPFVTTEQTEEAEIAILNKMCEKLSSYQNTENPLFTVDTVGNFRNYTSSGTRYGILPLPGFDGSATVGLADSHKVNYFLCPDNTTTAEGAGIVMSALGAAASQREAEVLLTLIRESARDNGTLLISHLLFSAPAWDSEF